MKKSKKKNPFTSMVEIYDKYVKKHDKAGFGDYYKYGTEQFFEYVGDEFKEDGEDIHISNVEYLDGYFIFGMGTNSVVHFNIDECPGWKFAIWWDEPDKKEFKKSGTIKGTFFTQYERTLDKFKPSRSVIKNDIEISVKNVFVPYVGDVCRTIKFIRDEKYLAFCRDYYGYDYNTRFLSRDEAEKMFIEWETKENLEEKIQKEYNDACIKFMQENVIPMFKNSFILDEGEWVSPRYSIIVPLNDNLDEFEEFGCYSIGDDELEEEYEQLKKEFKDKEEEFGVWLDNPFHFCCDVVGRSYEDLKKELGVILT